MKNVIAKTIVLMTAALALNAEARSLPQPAIDPIDPSYQPVIQLNVGGGMPAPGGLVGRQITVTRTGVVRVHEKRYGTDMNNIFDNGEERDYVLAQVEPIAMLMIGQAVEQIQGGPLEDKSNQPPCMDAPGYTYSAYKGLTKVTIFQVVSCRQQPLKDRRQRPAALSLKNFLDQLNQAAH